MAQEIAKGGAFRVLTYFKDSRAGYAKQRPELLQRFEGEGGSPAEFQAALDGACAKGWFTKNGNRITLCPAGYYVVQALFPSASSRSEEPK